VILYPAIDLKDGACVRLVQGEMASATRFNDDPAAQAHDLPALQVDRGEDDQGRHSRNLSSSAMP